MPAQNHFCSASVLPSTKPWRARRAELRSVNGQIEYLLKEAVRKRDVRFVEEKEAGQGEDAKPDS